VSLRARQCLQTHTNIYYNFGSPQRPTCTGLLPLQFKWPCVFQWG